MTRKTKNPPIDEQQELIEQLTYLKLLHSLEHHEDLAQQAAKASW